MMPRTKNEREPFIRLLRDPAVGKMAHNMMFEDDWSNVRLKTEVVNWVHDSMLCAFILDNRTKTTGLKFQSLVHFGLYDYDSHIDPYKKSTEKGGNAYNTLEEFIEKYGERELLIYCGMDTLLQRRLSLLQMRKFNESRSKN